MAWLPASFQVATSAALVARQRASSGVTLRDKLLRARDAVSAASDGRAAGRPSPRTEKTAYRDETNTFRGIFSKSGSNLLCLKSKRALTRLSQNGHTVVTPRPSTPSLPSPDCRGSPRLSLPEALPSPIRCGTASRKNLLQLHVRARTFQARSHVGKQAVRNFCSRGLPKIRISEGLKS